MESKRPNARCICAAIVGFAVASVFSSATSGQSTAWATFDSDPKWDGFRNLLLPEVLPIVRQNFRYRDSKFAGGKAGEIGGTVHRADRRATYAKATKTRTLNDRLSASGTFAVTRAGGSSGAMIGWFNDAKSQGWRTPQSIAFRIDGNGGKYWLFFEYGTSQYGTGGGGAFEGERYQTTSTKPFLADGTVHRWSLDYDPDGADGRGLIKFRCDDRTYEIALAPGHKEQGATFDRFGIWNPQTAGDSLDVFLDDVQIDGDADSFDSDPKWLADGNPVEYEQRVLRPFHDFGYRTTAHAGGKAGEIGGVVFRDEQPMYYADRVGPFTLDDELSAAGRITVRSAGADSALAFGWFDGDAKRRKMTPEHEERQTDYLCIMVEGPSRIGHFFRGGYSTAKGRGDAPTFEGQPNEAPVIRPDGSVHDWSLHYDPAAVDGRGRITVTLDKQSRHFDLKEGERAESATLNRFGIFNVQSGGHHVEAYLDDITYTKSTN